MVCMNCTAWSRKSFSQLQQGGTVSRADGSLEDSRAMDAIAKNAAGVSSSTADGVGSSLDGVTASSGSLDSRLSDRWSFWYDNSSIGGGGGGGGAGGGGSTVYGDRWRWRGESSSAPMGSGLWARGNKVDLHNWDSFLQLVFTFETIEEFWGLLNNVMEPSMLPLGGSYHLFREGIEPKWEDDANEAGGKWVLTLPKSPRDTVDTCWLHLMLAVLGEQFPDRASADITGIVVSVRRGQDRISLWTRSAFEQELQELIGSSWRDLACPTGLPCSFRLEYQVHKDAMAKTPNFGKRGRYRIEG